MTMTEQRDLPPLDPSIARAPLPTRRTLRRRRNPVIQLVRFLLLNARMGYLAMKKHG